MPGSLSVSEHHDLRALSIDQKRHKSRRVKYNKYSTVCPNEISSLHLVAPVSRWPSERWGAWPADYSSYIPRQLTKREFYEKAQEGRLHKRERSCPDRRRAWWGKEAEELRGTKEARAYAQRSMKNPSRGTQSQITLGLTEVDTHYLNSLDIEAWPGNEASTLQIEVLIDEALRIRKKRMRHDLAQKGWVDVEDEPSADEWCELDDIDILSSTGWDSS